MPYHHTYRRGYRHTRRPFNWDLDDFEKIKHDIEDDAEDSEKVNKLKAKVKRDRYRKKIKKLKKKLVHDFKKQDKIKFQRFQLMGDPEDPTKDFISVIFLILEEDEAEQIYEAVLEFIQKAIVRTNLVEYFNIRNFGDEEATATDEIEFLFVRENHSYDRLRQIPRIQQDDEEETGEGGVPPAGGMGEPGLGGSPEPDLGGEVPAGGEAPEGGEVETEPEPEEV